MSSNPKYKPDTKSWHFRALRAVFPNLKPKTKCGYWISAIFSAVAIVGTGMLAIGSAIYFLASLLGYTNSTSGCAKTGACNSLDMVLFGLGAVVSMIAGICLVAAGIVTLSNSKLGAHLGKIIILTFDYTLGPLVYVIAWIIKQPLTLLAYQRDKIFDALCPTEVEYEVEAGGPDPAKVA